MNLKKHEALVYSAIGIAALFFILVALNYLIAAAPLRLDLTAGKLYTLSDGTKTLLKSLKSPVTIKLYISRGDAMPVQLRSYASRVEDMVRQFKSVAGAKLIVQKYNPAPDSEEEDAAQIDGVEPQQLMNGESFYLGAAVQQLDRKEAIPEFSPQRERLLEYDLVRAIARVGGPARPKIGLMSAMPVLGEGFNPYTRRASDPWVLADELKNEFKVEPIPMSATEIDKDIHVLLVIHPRNITPQTEYALDQFVLRGGKLIAFVDPYAYFDQQGPQYPGMPPTGTSSTLPTLFKAWGIAMNTNKVISDLVYASGAGQHYTPTVLTLNPTAFAHNDPVASEASTLLYAFGGAFTFVKGGKPAAGLTATDLVKSSPNSMLVDEAFATRAGDQATKDFRPSGIEYPLALRLTGKFKTAFPGGPPAGAVGGPPAGAKGKPAPATAPQLKASDKDNSVALVADVDMLNDGAAVDIQQVFGRRIVVPSNSNLAFAVGLVEQVASGDTLLSLRSRASSFRPLTVVRQMEANAQKQYLGKIQALEGDLQATTQKLKALQQARGAGVKSAQILSPEEQKELDSFRKKVAETKKALKEVRKNLRRDAENLVFWTKVANIALMPLLVALAGLLVALARRRRADRREVS